MGALIAEVSHTLPVPITGLASDEELVEELDLERSSYEGPTGIVGVVHDCCRQVGMSSASLWAAVPHYVAAVPNPKAALALLRRLEGLTGIAVDASELEEETAQAMRSRSAEPSPPTPRSRSWSSASRRSRPSSSANAEDLPSADTIAREFQRFLRQQGELLALGSRADQPVIAPAADGRRGPRLEVLAEHPLADLQARSARPARRRRAWSAPPPSRRRARSSSCRRRPRRPRPRGRRGGRARAAGRSPGRPRSCARRSCSRSARSRRRAGGRPGRPGRARGARRSGCRTSAPARPARPRRLRSRSQ